MSDDKRPDWWIFQGQEDPHDGIERLARIPPPPWRAFTDAGMDLRGKVYRPEPEEIELVNAAIYLRRPLLVTGRAGIGKTTLAYSVARELKLGRVLRWSVTTQSTLKDALYGYDAVGRLQETSLRGTKKAAPIEKFLRLGPLGTAFADSATQPRVLLIDEIDKSDIDLPNDLLHIFEEGEFEIPELSRLETQDTPIQIQPHEPAPGDQAIPVRRGKVRCGCFPVVIMTSNGEREFPPAFLRRCLQLEVDWPADTGAKKRKLAKIVEAHLASDERFAADKTRVGELLDEFIRRLEKDEAELATDQLLNAIYLVLKGINPQAEFPGRQQLLDALLRSLSR